MINGIVGLMNSGKTLYMTIKLYQEYLKGKEIMSNYDLNFPHKKVNKDFIEYLGQTQPILENVAFGLDELWIWLDARKHSQNTVATYFFNQSSKDDTMIYFTAQHNGQMEKRIRDNLHTLSQCSRVVYMNGKMQPISEDKRFLSKDIQSRLYIKVVNFKRVNMGYFTEMIPKKPIYYKAELFFLLYDTTQKISNKNKVLEEM